MNDTVVVCQLYSSDCLVGIKHYSFEKRLSPGKIKNQLIYAILYHAIYCCIVIQEGIDTTKMCIIVSLPVMLAEVKSYK